MPPIDYRPKTARIPKKKPAPKAKPKRVAPAKSPVFGPLKRADEPVRQAQRQARQRTDKAIEKLPTYKARQEAAAETPQGRQRQAKVRQSVREATNKYSEHGRARVATSKAVRALGGKSKGDLPRADALRDAIRLGYATHTKETTPGRFVYTRERKGLPDIKVLIPTRNIKDYVRESQRVVEASDPLKAVGLKALEVSARPSHAVAAGVRSLGEGKGVKGLPKAWLGGLSGKNKDTFGKILKDAGAPTAVAAAGGFALDVVADPTTYVSGGTRKVAQSAAMKAATRVEKKALAKGLTREQARRMAQRAATQTERKMTTKGSGLSVKVAGREVPGVTRATAAAGRGVKKVAGKAPESAKGAGRGAKNLARDVRPTIAPAGVERGEFEAARHAARSGRAKVNQGVKLVEAEAQGLRKRIGQENYDSVIDAIERARIGALPAELREPARILRDRFRHAKRLRRRAGVAEGTVGGKTVTLGAVVKTKKGRLTRTTAVKRNEGPKGYVPHAQEQPLKAGQGVVEGVTARRGNGRGARTVTPDDAARGRQIKTTLAKANEQLEREGRGRFSTDLPLVYANYQRSTVKQSAKAEVLRKLAASGRRIKPKIVKGKSGYRRAYEPVDLREGDAIYHLASKDGKLGLREIADKDWRTGRVPKTGQYVVLNKKTVDDALRAGEPHKAESTLGRGIDRFTRGFKSIAVATPGFHARNAVGDTQMAYLSQPGHRLPGNIVAGGRALRVLGKQERAARKMARPVRSGKTIKIAGKPMPIEDFLNGAREHGVIRSGYVGRELEDLGGRGARAGIKRVKRGVGHRVGRAIQNREDIIRLATYKHGLDEGMPPVRAADLSLETHIDYGDLTRVERQYMRRAMPFYTFSARALPLHAKRLLQRPGKFANYEKLRQEVAFATGLDLYATQKDLSETQQRQLPVLLQHGGKVYVVSDALPLTMLNELPIDMVKVDGVALPFVADPREYMDEVGEFLAALANPAVKMPIELYANKSFFFRNDIQSKDRPLVAAPSWVSMLPKKARDKIGIVPDMVDRKTGEKHWGWPARIDYFVKSVPGPVNAANRAATQGSNRVGQSTLSSLTPSLIGVRSQPADKPSEQINRLYDRKDALAEKAAALRQRGVNASNPTPEYERLLKQQRDIEHEIYRISKKRGDKDPLGSPPPKSELSPQEQMRREFEEYTKPGKKSPADELREEFERFAKGGG